MSMYKNAPNVLSFRIELNSAMLLLTLSRKRKKKNLLKIVPKRGEKSVIKCLVYKNNIKE